MKTIFNTVIYDKNYGRIYRLVRFTADRAFGVIEVASEQELTDERALIALRLRTARERLRLAMKMPWVTQ